MGQTISLSIAEFKNMIANGGPIPSADDTLTVTGSDSQLRALTAAEISHFSTYNIDFVGSTTTSFISYWDVEKASAFLQTSCSIKAGTAIGISGSPAALLNFDAAAVASLSAKGFSSFSSTSSTESLIFSADWFVALGNMRLISSDITLADSAGRLLLMTQQQLASLSGKIHKIDVLDNNGLLPLKVEQALSFAGQDMVAQGDSVTVVDSGQNLTALTSAEIASLSARQYVGLDGNTDSWEMSAGEFDALGDMLLGSESVITIRDEGASIEGLDFQKLKDKGIDVLDASDNAVTLTVAQATTLAGSNLNFHGSDTVTVSGTGAQLAALTVAQIIALAAKGVDTFDASDNLISLTPEQVAALGAIKFAAGDTLNVIPSNTGGGGAQVVTGPNIITGTSRKDSLTGTAGDDIITGLAGNDALKGGLANDILRGDFGNDVLAGGGGKDIFVFDSRLSKKANFDRITDFNARDDAIWLDNAIFKKLGKKGSEAAPAKLNKAFFKVAEKAQDKNDYLFFSKSKSTLYYDADGSGTTAKAVEIAKMNKKPALADFFVI